MQSIIKYISCEFIHCRDTVNSIPQETKQEVEFQVGETMERLFYRIDISLFPFNFSL